MEQRDYYADLNVDPSSSSDEIARAFRLLARETHPDHHPNDPAAYQSFQAVNEAYQVLSDPQRRAEYDQQRALAPAFWRPAANAAGASPTEPPVPPTEGVSAQQPTQTWTDADIATFVGQVANQFANEMRAALMNFGEELDSLSQSFRNVLPNQPPRQGFPPPPRRRAPPNSGRPPFNGKPPTP